MGRVESRLRILIKQKELSENRDITYTEISTATSIAASVLSKLVNDKTKRYSNNVLSALCEYFNCQVGDLLVYVPDESAEASK